MQTYRNLFQVTAAVLARVVFGSPARRFAEAKRARLALVATMVVAAFAPAAWATPISYNFTVSNLTGPLAGNSYHGTFSYDSSIVVPGEVPGAPQLSDFDFTFDGVTYDAEMVETGLWEFDADGRFAWGWIRSKCVTDLCGFDARPYSWAAGLYEIEPGVQGYFAYSEAFFGRYIGMGGVEIFRNMDTPPALHVPEPGAFGMFGLGVLLLFGTAGWRRMGTQYEGCAGP